MSSLEANELEKAVYPVLCGGTFFTLLLEARQARSGKKDQLYGTTDGLSEPDTLAGLVRVMYPEFKKPSGVSTFRTNTAEYKACRNNGGNLPFFEKEIRAFDNRVKTDYKTALAQMCEFTNHFIEVGGSVKRDEWLIKALLDLIETDQSILDTDEFFVCENGQALSKAMLRSVTAVCLPAFLLGVWHFAIVNRQDNTVGRTTFEGWCPSNNRKTRAYKGTLGESINRPITVKIPAEITATEKNASSAEDDAPADCCEPIVEEPESTTHTTTQIISSPAVFFNSGPNCQQINNMGVINIGRGGNV